tara:strand:- start:1184 stop:1414 length:231 start_codon:yes stop_codon:yes gene_type:complete
METLIKSNDRIYVSWIKSILKAHNIEYFTFDEEMSMTEGNITAIPIRIIVNEKEISKALQIIKNEEKLISSEQNKR